jgi:hypothetical protein
LCYAESGEPEGGNMTHAHTEIPAPPPIAGSKPAAAHPSAAATLVCYFLLFPFYFSLSRVAAIAAALPLAAVANIAACSPFSFPLILIPSQHSVLNTQHFIRFLPAIPLACARREAHVSRRFPAVSRPRGRHSYDGGNGKYSFPAIAFSLSLLPFAFFLFPFYSKQNAPAQGEGIYSRRWFSSPLAIEWRGDLGVR